MVKRGSALDGYGPKKPVKARKTEPKEKDQPRVIARVKISKEAIERVAREEEDRMNNGNGDDDDDEDYGNDDDYNESSTNHNNNFNNNTSMSSSGRRLTKPSRIGNNDEDSDNREYTERGRGRPKGSTRTGSSKPRREAARKTYQEPETDDDDDLMTSSSSAANDQGDLQDDDGLGQAGPGEYAAGPAIEKIMARRTIRMSHHPLHVHVPIDPRSPKEIYVKWKGLSYLHCSWINEEVLLAQKQGPAKLERFIKLQAANEARGLDEEEWFPPEFVEVDRVLAEREGAEGGAEFLVKWLGQQYFEATWEAEAALEGFADKIAKFRRDNELPDNWQFLDSRVASTRPRPDQFVQMSAKDFGESKAGNNLRTYQVEGVNWLHFSWYNRRNTILADEMGLGKTVQTVQIFKLLFTKHKIRGPFLIVAPLSTLAHWQREFEAWTDMNAVV